MGEEIYEENMDEVIYEHIMAREGLSVLIRC